MISIFEELISSGYFKIDIAKYIDIYYNKYLQDKKNIKSRSILNIYIPNIRK